MTYFFNDETLEWHWDASQSDYKYKIFLRRTFLEENMDNFYSIKLWCEVNSKKWQITWNVLINTDFYVVSFPDKKEATLFKLFFG
jgi:hypothetical protein